MFSIKKIFFKNFKIFREFSLNINKDINIFVGDNGSGKSSILQGLELALSGSSTRVQNIGLERLMNKEAINECLVNKDISLLPKLVIEVYFSQDAEVDSPANEFFMGEKNELGEEAYGIRLVCEPKNEYMTEIKACLKSDMPVFPFELYEINHKTFKGDSFNPYKKPLKTIFIDSSEINSKYALTNTVKETYISSVTDYERVQNRQNYKKIISQYEFIGLAKNEGVCVSSNLEDNLSIEQDGVLIENLGKGEINIIKTTYALNRTCDAGSIIFLEEPENHLTHNRMRKMLCEIIKKIDNQQIFIATHSSQIVSRLGLDKVFFIAKAAQPISLKQLDSSTANFFKRAPSDNLLQFILAPRVVLVEGAAEYILMERFYKQETEKLPEQDNVWIISINGLSFARYLGIAKFIGNRVSVICDNDKSSKPKYSEFCGKEIQVFSDSNVNRYTFEICMYEDNKTLCENLFNKKNTLNWMLNHKAEASYLILQESGNISLSIPEYIRQALAWIRQ